MAITADERDRMLAGLTPGQRALFDAEFGAIPWLRQQPEVLANAIRRVQKARSGMRERLGLTREQIWS